ncbi:acylphosphatase [Armatimonas sp.]|uniref:acylphosphatase n=1 Tax=Armatimonas sp. TaxID=1872638 RepID=UPI00286CB542|nr:acylphosphatase [Armatimonas sp.]
MIRLQAKIQGNVQGVGFRYWVHHTAQRLTGVGGGYVKNLPDGSVHVEAEALERAPLQALLAELHRGPTQAQVTAVEAHWEENIEGSHLSFRVA